MRPLIDFPPAARIQVSFLILSSSTGDDSDVLSQHATSDIA